MDHGSQRAGSTALVNHHWSSVCVCVCVPAHIDTVDDYKQAAASGISSFFAECGWFVTRPTFLCESPGANCLGQSGVGNPSDFGE